MSNSTPTPKSLDQVSMASLDTVAHWMLIVTAADRDHISYTIEALGAANLYDPLVCPTCVVITQGLRRYMGLPATERCDHNWVCFHCGMVKP